MADLTFNTDTDSLEFGVQEAELTFEDNDSDLEFNLDDPSLQFDVVEQNIDFSNEEINLNFQAISVGAKGKDGIDGDAGSSVRRIADIALGGHRCVITTATGITYADSSNITHLGLVLGITTSAVLAGEEVAISTVGEVIEPSWSFALGNVYVGLNGNLTQIVPLSGFIQIIGVAISPTVLLVAPKIAITI